MMKCGFCQWPSYLMAVELEDGSEGYTGFCIDLINIVAKELQFSYSVTVPQDGEWGDERGGNWTGLMGQLQRKEVDMAVFLAPSVERSAVADWSVPFDNWYNGVAVRRDGGNPALTIFLSPLQWQVYVCIAAVLAFVLAVTPGLSLIQRLVEVHAPAQPPSVGDVLLSMFGMLLVRATPYKWEWPPTRCVIAAWSLLGLVLTSCYTCNLTSLFVDLKTPPPFQSLADMVSRGDFRWGAVGGTKLLTSLRTSKDEVEQAVYRGLEAFSRDDPEVLSGDPEVHLSKVLSGHYAFIGEGATLELWASRYCEVTVLPDRLTGLEHYAIALPRHSPLRSRIDDVLLRLQDSGVLSHLRSRWFPSPDSCHDNQTTSKVISLTTMQGPFYVATVGLLLAFGIVLVELAVYKCKARSRGLFFTTVAE